jgi:phosphoserine phosphatase RsbU/P
MRDVSRGQTFRHMHRDFRDLYAYYLDESQQARLASMGRIKRYLFLCAWFLRGLILKLPPARRLLLLLAFFLMFQGDLVYSDERFVIDLKMSFFAFFLMLVILMLELKDKLLAKDELAVGRAVQIALMPTGNPALAGWDLWLYTQPANDVGGDLVDYLSLPGGRLGISLGDVSGKGLGAALLMAKLQSTLRAYATERYPLNELGQRVNTVFFRDGLPGKFATLVYLELEPGLGSVRLLNAGHMPPLLLAATSLEKTPPGALPLGIFPDAVFREVAVEVPPKTTLVLYSDGLTEAFNAKEEFFGEERLLALLPKLAGVSAEAAGKRIIREVEEFLGGERPGDDLSLAILRRLGPGEESPGEVSTAGPEGGQGPAPGPSGPS